MNEVAKEIKRVKYLNKELVAYVCHGVYVVIAYVDDMLSDTFETKDELEAAKVFCYNENLMYGEE